MIDEEKFWNSFGIMIVHFGVRRLYSSFPLIWSSTNMIFLAQKWTNFKLHQNDHPPKWSKLRTRGKLESFLMISSVLRQLFFRFVLCENHFYEDQNENRRKNSLFLLRNPRLCILYTLLLQKPVPGTVCKGISNAKHPIFWIWTLTLSTSSNSTKMITHQNDLSF